MCKSALQHCEQTYRAYIRHTHAGVLHDQHRPSHVLLESLQQPTTASLPIHTELLCSIQNGSPAFPSGRPCRRKSPRLLLHTAKEHGEQAAHGDRGCPPPRPPSGTSLCGPGARAHRSDPTHGYSHNGSATATTTEFACNQARSAGSHAFNSLVQELLAQIIRTRWHQTLYKRLLVGEDPKDTTSMLA